MLIRSIPLNLK